MTRKRIIRVSVSLILVAAAFVYGLRLVESAMTFRPSRMAGAQEIPSGAEDISFNSTDGTRLNGWFFASHSQPEVATMIFFHGNGGNISTLAGWHRDLRSTGSMSWSLIIAATGGAMELLPTNQTFTQTVMLLSTL